MSERSISTKKPRDARQFDLALFFETAIAGEPKIPPYHADLVVDAAGHRRNAGPGTFLRSRGSISVLWMLDRLFPAGRHLAAGVLWNSE